MLDKGPSSFVTGARPSWALSFKSTTILGVNTSARAHLETSLIRGLLRLPEPWLRRLVGRPIRRDGRSLDPQVQLALKAHRLVRRKGTSESSVEEVRARLDLVGNQLGVRPNPELESVVDRTLAGRPVRHYTPRGSARPGPALLWFHGGGFVSGSLDSHDAVCRQMASETPCRVLAVDYRLAPEHPFPAAVEDAMGTFREMRRRASELGVDVDRIAVGGDSAGGNLAAVVALETRTESSRPRAQLLVYPAVDMTMSFPSVASLGEGFFLEARDIEWYRAHYLGDHDPTDPRASPWFAQNLSGVPPAVISTAGFDPLRDEGDAWAQRLAEAGASVHHQTHGGLFHGFWNTGGSIRSSQTAIQQALSALRDLLTS